jgi:hypothetical protein
MIPTWLDALFVFAAATGFFTLIGLPLARLAAPEGVVPIGLAPAIGWAAFSVLALPILRIISYLPVLIDLLAAAAAIVAIVFLLRQFRRLEVMPLWHLAPSALAALLPLMAIMPKYTASGMLLAPPMFDHVKIALVDSIARIGLPILNPFAGPAEQARLVYYYLWHFSAGLFATALPPGGWAADAGLTGFTAFASLALVISTAHALGAARLAWVLVPLASLIGSLRPLLKAVLGPETELAFMPPSSDIGGWLNQAAWVPQHLAAACCALLGILILVRLRERGGWFLCILLGIIAAAGFESSSWVGGIGFAAGACGAVLLIAASASASERTGLLLRCAAAAAVAIAVASPFLLAQASTLAARQIGFPIQPAPYPVFGTFLPGILRWPADLIAFFPFFLPFCLPLVFPAGAAGAWLAWRGPGTKPPLWRGLTGAVLGFLGVAWLLRSTIDNNDLGWRVPLPAILIFTAVTAVVLDRLWHAASRKWLAACAAAAALGLPGTIVMLIYYAGGQPSSAAAAFAASNPAWEAVRRHSGSMDRILNNPNDLASLTPWPGNLGWALLSDRPSCYAGWEAVRAYGGLTLQAQQAAEARVSRVFAGTPQPGDIAALAKQDGCELIVLTPRDPAWSADPLAKSADYHLADGTPAWRIYRHSAE